MRKILFLFSISFAMRAQSLTLTSPAANQTIGGMSFTLSVSLPSLPVYSIEYDINGETACIVTTPPYSCTWNTYNVINNIYNSITAVARDAGNGIVATSAAVSPFTVDNPLPESLSQFNWTIATGTPLTSNWSGTVSVTHAFTGSNAPAGNNFVQRVDGVLYSGNSIDTTKYDNGVHRIVLTNRDTIHPVTTLSDGAWQQVAQYEKDVTFANGAVAMELRSNAAEVFLCTSPSPNCLTTFTLIPTVYNADGSTSTASSPSFVSGDPTIVIVGASNGVLSPVAPGSTQITITANGFTSKPWVFVNTQNAVPHFGSDGTILSAYNPTKSLFVNSIFQSCGVGIAANGSLSSGVGGVLDGNYPPQFSFAKDFSDSGWNVCETSLYNAPGGGVTQSAWQAGQTAFVANMAALISAFPKIHLGLVGDSMTRQTTDLFASTRGIGSTFSPTSIQYTFSSWLAQHPIFAVMQDEVNSTWGFNPNQGNAQIGTPSGPTSIDCSANPCTVAWAGFSIQTGTSKFLISGSGDVNLDFNTTTNSPALYQANQTSNNSFTFPRPAGVTGIYTASSNPNLTVHPLVAQTFQGTGVNYPGAAGCASAGGGNALPCIDWVRWDAFQFIRAQANNVAGRMAQTYAPRADTGAATMKNWGTGPISDWSNVYTTTATIYYLANQYPLADINQGDYFTTPRQLYGSYNPNTPMVLNSDGSNVTWSIQGFNAPIASCDGNVITFTAPHGVTNVLPVDTRMTVTGSSGTACDGIFYAISSPTASTMSIYYSQGQFAASLSGLSGVTARFQDGTTYQISSLTASLGSFNSPIRFTVPNNTDPGCTIFRKQFQTVTFSTTGSPIGSFANKIFYVFQQDPGACPNNPGMNAAQVPVFSSTGGAANIIPNNAYQRGRSWPGPSGQEQGPRYNFATVTGCALLRCAGQRAYILGQNWDGYKGSAQVAFRQEFTSNSIQDIQGAMHPRWDYAASVATWQALSLPTLLITRLAKFYFQPNLPSPDYGRFINCAAHSGANGNLLMCQSYSNGPSITRTIDLRSIAVAGQKTIKYCVSWQNIAITTLNAGATSDNQTFTPDSCSFVAYVGTVNSGSEYSPPVISAQLADVAGAAKIVVHYNYLPYYFTTPSLRSMMLPQAFDCGAGTACILPVDRQIGTVWYRVAYVHSSGRVLATSDLQSF